MKKLLLINVSANTGSTGRIAEEIGESAIANGFDSYFAYGRKEEGSECHLMRIGCDFDNKIHVLQTRLFDNHCFASNWATRQFIKEIDRLRPNVINIHNIHGYYANLEVLLNYLSKKGIPIVWTLHDCWTFTGHCSYFDAVHCDRWKSHCHNCPNKYGYPTSLFLDSSRRNYDRKKALFSKMNNITFVTPSEWLQNLVRESYLSIFPVKVINNGVDVDVFKPCVSTEIRKRLLISEHQRIILGVASIWDRRKGLDDFIKLCDAFKDDKILLVGLNDEQISFIPDEIIPVMRTENVNELAELYSIADVFVNPTYVDNFPTTNIEALACGTPVVTYDTGGSPETVDSETGLVVEQGNITLLAEAIKTILLKDREQQRISCRARALRLYDKRERFNEYVDLFNQLINK